MTQGFRDEDRRLQLEFHCSKITSDAGLLAFRELDDALSLTELAGSVLADNRTGRNSRHSLIAQFRQLVLIKEGKYAVKWTHLSCRTMKANAVRLQLHALAYNLANFLRTLALPDEMASWSMTTLRDKVVKIGAKVIAHPWTHRFASRLSQGDSGKVRNQQHTSTAPEGRHLLSTTPDGSTNPKGQAVRASDPSFASTKVNQIRARKARGF